MNAQIALYAPALLLIGMSALLASVIAWRWRSTRGAAPLALLSVAAGLWSFGYAFELLSDNLAQILFWIHFEYIGIVATPTCWLLFALAYTNHEHWLRRGWLAILLALPCATLLIVWTNAAHGLFYRRIELVHQGGASLINPTYGPWFWVHLGYSYLYLLVGSLLLIAAIIRSPTLFRGNLGAMLVALCVPWLGNILYLFDLSPLGNLDLTPLAFTVSSLAITLSIVRLRLFNLVPIARSTVIDQMGEGVIVLDEATLVVDANPSAANDLSSTPRQLIGLPAHDVFANWPELVSRYRQTIAASEEIMVASRARQRWFDVRISPILDTRGHMRGRLIIWHDITSIKQAELALVSAKEAAEAASRAKSAFLANMSHELRTPLSAVIGYTQLMRLELARGDTGAISHDLDVVEKAGAHLLGLINNLLQLSQIEAGAVKLQLAMADPGAIVDDVAAAVQPLMARRSNRLVVERSPDSQPIPTDATKLRQVLFNLLDNAAKFTEHGTVTLVYGRQPASGWMLLTVSDTGIGMSADEMARLFVMFAEPDAEKRRKFGGTGVGLAISRYFCRLMGGDLEVTSGPGRGSTFTVRLPIAGPAADHDSSAVRGPALATDEWEERLAQQETLP